MTVYLSDMVKDMIGLALNEEGYATYPYSIFKPIEEYVKGLNWRITNVECGRDGSDYAFPFERQEDFFIDGETLFAMLQDHPEIQWWWGSLSGFPKEIRWDEIKRNPVVDLTLRQPYLENTLHHLEPKAVLEVIAFDSTETYILIDDQEVADRIISAFPKAESLDKYVFESAQ